MLHWETRWIIVHIDFWRWQHLYLFLGALYVLGMVCVEWWAPGTWAPLNVWRPETWWMTIWKGK
jgi:hypothetical protein